MAYDKNQNEPGVPLNSNDKRKSSDLLPRIYRTDANKKFIGATVDQLTQPGKVKKVNGYIGRKNAKAVTATDIFIEASDADRTNYQLEPAAIIEDYLGNVSFLKDYIDHINHIEVNNGITTNHERLNKQEFYSWNPHICWDKFANFQQYFWLPYGPLTISVAGQQQAIESTYTVFTVDEGDTRSFVFTPDGLSKNPPITLYRGQTYNFVINSPGEPFSIKTSRTIGSVDRYVEGVSASAVENGEIKFQVAEDAPDFLFYMSENNIDVGGSFKIQDITENTFLDINKDILGKKTYTMVNGVPLSNGMKIRFSGAVVPEIYTNSVWYVEGVGDKITLVNQKDLEIISTYTSDSQVLFDDSPFDQLPFSDATSIAATKDYLTVNRASPDRNPWSRYNRWFHEDVIKTSYELNGLSPDVDQTFRAKRPIIEFNAGIKLHNFGYKAKQNVDLIDTFTKDVFSTIEGSTGYSIDNVDLVNGHRVLFAADTDIRVNGKIFEVKLVNIKPPNRQVAFDGVNAVEIPTNHLNFIEDHGLVNGKKVEYLSNGNTAIGGLLNRQIYYVYIVDNKRIRLYFDKNLTEPVILTSQGEGTHLLDIVTTVQDQITLVETSDTMPLNGETLLIKFGQDNQGLMYHYNGTAWIKGQEKTSANQAPLFDLFDKDGYSFSDILAYDGSSFAGNKIFSYKTSTLTADTELGFGLSYQNISNVGDILFEFNLLSDTFRYKQNYVSLTKNTDTGFVKIIYDLTTSKYANGWRNNLIANVQPIIRIYEGSEYTDNFPIDVYSNVNNLSDLEVRVLINGKRIQPRCFTVETGLNNKFVSLVKNQDFSVTVTTLDVVTLKCFSKQAKNQNGHYEIPLSLQNNPLNSNVQYFTLGEVVDHVSTIADNIPGFVGNYIGQGNLRDLGDPSAYGTRFVQHSCPLNLTLYHLGSKTANVLKSIEVAKEHYATFKRLFLRLAGESGSGSNVREHVDEILYQITQNSPKTNPYYLSDMFGYGPSVRTEYVVLDFRTTLYPLTNVFDMNTLSNKSVLVYLNGEQLIHSLDYTFTAEGYVDISTTLSDDDIIEIYEYDSTDGTFVPQTPTKLGIWPKYQPQIYRDTTYVEPTDVIQGHDGSITIAFGDYRDDLLLELEKRIFNNIKIDYNPDIFHVPDVLPGYHRTTDYTVEEYNQVLAKYFYHWSSQIDQDYTRLPTYDRTNGFTFNYRGNITLDGRAVPAHWRAIYKWVLDTDRPHSHPWEVLGFTIKPSWWESIYGPAPYTSNNKILWQDLNDGTVKEPGKPVTRRAEFKRPGLIDTIPVDHQGRLISPYDAGMVSGFINPSPAGYLEFGDQGPVETAWRRSSLYPFAALLAFITLAPNKILGTCLDRSRLIKNIANQIVYRDTELRLQLADIILPSNVNDGSRVFASGLINYISDQIFTINGYNISNYKSDLSNLSNKIISKLGGFTSKEKFKLILDSKSPVSNNSVFVPQENYNIVLNTSSPIKKLSYSGVIIVKVADGFNIAGYNQDEPYFSYYPKLQDGPTIRIGGISESFTEYDTNQLYVAGKVLRYTDRYYRVKTNHKSGESFDKDLYVLLPALPESGGVVATLGKVWDKRTALKLSYGTTLTTIQQVVNFLEGYGVYLEEQGFTFDSFNVNTNAVSNWETSLKEFMFWTTQKWKEGAVISLSPSAEKLTLSTEFSVVNDIKDSFYGYNILRVDGQKLDPDLTSVYRSDSEYAIAPSNTAHGIYSATFYLIQKEHVVIIDNRTMFNDVIYDLAPGYRQERIKINGYLTQDWTGGFNIPGFIYDEAIIKDWEQWVDYALGTIVKYKEFYYSANAFIPGAELFDSSLWKMLLEKPTSRLLPNWDYKAEQFTDFYDLDTDNFDAGQQKVAQHLIGYQNRQYLENIIKDDVSQYKFYQGMIIEKGTKNVLNKLFDVLSANDQESLEFDEEWAVRVGEYGASAAFDEIEIQLKEDNFKINPQPLEFVNSINASLVDSVYRQVSTDLIIKPTRYNSTPWPTKAHKARFLRTPGYVRYDDVHVSVDTLTDLVGQDISTFTLGDYVWCAFENLNSFGDYWNVYRLTTASFTIRDVEYVDGVITFECIDVPNVTAGDVIGISHSTDVDGFYTIVDIVDKKISVEKELTNFNVFADSTEITVYELVSQRISNIDEANELLSTDIKPKELIWSDSNEQSNTWAVWENNSVYAKTALMNAEPKTEQKFGVALATSKLGDVAVVGTAENKALIYNVFNGSWSRLQELPSTGLGDIADFANSSFAQRVAMSDDGAWLAIAAPYASNIKTHYKGEYDESANYDKNDIVKVGNVHWQAMRDLVDADTSTIDQFAQDWQPARLIEATKVGTGSAYTGQGLVALYRRLSDGSYRFSTVFTSPDPSINNEAFGSKLEFAQSDSEYILGVSSPGTGKIYLYRYSTVSDDSGVEWHMDYDRKYRDAFNSLTDYYRGDLVFYNQLIYEAIEDIPSGAFNIDQWIVTTNKNIIGYFPNDILDIEDTSPVVDKFGYDFDFSSTGDRLVISAPAANKVFVYQYNGTSYDLIVPVLQPAIGDLGINERFGASVAISTDGNSLAIGITDINGTANTGKVFVYNLSSDTYDKVQTINSIGVEADERFGSRVKFMNNNNTLVIFSKTGDTSINNTVVFDNGRIDIFDKYSLNYIYGESLTFDDSALLKYGESITIADNMVLVSAPNYDFNFIENTGIVYQFKKSKNSYSWSKIYQESAIVDVDKIKKAFIYNSRTNSLLKYLDVVDPVQGKIAGIADQEIKFKTYFDPAIYTVSTNSLNVDIGSDWTVEHVGTLWWDLTKARFLDSYVQDIVYRASTWNTLYKTASIDVYEWVESKLLPTAWDEIADTEVGLSQAISGKSLYGNAAYSIKQRYDSVSKTFKNTYYFWVKNKTTVPSISGRSISALDVAKLISDPGAQGYQFISFLSDNSISLYNLKSSLKNNDINLNVQYWIIDNTNLNSHYQWKIISENANSLIPAEIENKWFHSLVGKDANDRTVPDLQLPVKLRYGIESRPRQSMFVHRLEALKQVIERVNSVLLQNLIADDYDLSDLMSSEAKPSVVSGLYDKIIDIEQELRFINNDTLRRAVLTPVIVDGRITEVNIVDPGYGYGKLRVYARDGADNPISWYGPSLKIIGDGSNAELVTVVNTTGQITNVVIINSGESYGDSTTIVVRYVSVLVNSDSVALNRWSIHEWVDTSWVRARTQTYDVAQYWDYVDYYQPGYNQFIKVDYAVDGTYQLPLITTQIGDLVKVNNIGSGGWIILEKYSNVDSVDYTQSYRVVGRYQGTLQFKDSLYKYKDGGVGYDGNLFDSDGYDEYASTELSIILNALKDKIFVDTLRTEYLKLFFASVRYALSEQTLVDWVFKTSFVKARHNVGDLKQKVTYNNDNLGNFEDYINEVKPYRTKIREYVSNYNKLQTAPTSVMDFDLQATVSSQNTIVPVNVRVSPAVNAIPPVTEISGTSTLLEYPWRHWYDNVGFSISSIEVVDHGSGYITEPTVTIEDSYGTEAVAKAFISGGKVTKIRVLSPGSRFLKAPTITLSGGTPLQENYARAVAIIQNGVVRSSMIKMRFDRTTRTYAVSSIIETETFSGTQVTGKRLQFDLKWSPNTEVGKTLVTINGVELLRDDYTLLTKTTVVNGFTQYYGSVIFDSAPLAGSIVVIRYNKSAVHLNAADRINFYYDPQTGQLGKQLSQLMTGIDYGGVNVIGLDFNVKYGWDSLPWLSTPWDSFDESFDDYIYTGANYEVVLDYVPALDEEINVYISRYDPLDPAAINGYISPVRIDNNDYVVGEELPGYPNVVMRPFFGDGVNETVIIPEDRITINDNDIVIVRRATSDGSFQPLATDYDIRLDGGSIDYSSATGLNADDIIVDGDGFVTTTTSAAPEEVVPGHISDTVAIKVYHRPTSGSSRIISQNYNGDDTTTAFKIEQIPNDSGIFIVKVDDTILTRNADYEFDWESQEVRLNTAPLKKQKINITSFGLNSSSIIDLDYFISDGQSTEFITRASWSEQVEAFVLINGQSSEYILFETDSTYDPTNVGRVGIKFGAAPQSNSIITYAITPIIEGTPVLDKMTITRSEFFETADEVFSFPLTSPMGINLPYEDNSIVRIGQEILRSPRTFYFDLVNGQLTYTIPKYKLTPSSLTLANLAVYVNGLLLRPVVDYTFDGSGVSVTLLASSFVQGSKLAIAVLTDADYRIDLDESGTANLTLTETYPPGTEIEIITFYNHNILEIERSNNKLEVQGTLIPLTSEYYEFKKSTAGIFTLKTARTSSDYVWVTKNRKLLTRSIDYILGADGKTITLEAPLISSDVVEIITFNDQVTQTGFSYMQFKDILNRVHYKRLRIEKQTILARDLNYYDSEIEVVDGAALSVPVNTANIPGIIEVNGERIEYLHKDGNILGQLRRGTLGTGVPTVHPANTYVQDIGFEETIPYTDDVIVENHYSDGSTKLIPLDYTPKLTAGTVFDGVNLYTEWRRTATPSNFGQCDDVEVFVGGWLIMGHWAESTSYNSGDIVIYGSYTYRCALDHISSTDFVKDSTKWNLFTGNRRLKKVPYEVHCLDGGPESTFPGTPSRASADVEFDADFAVDGTTNGVRLNELPSIGTKITIIKKQGRLWNELGKSLAFSDTPVANFLKKFEGSWPR
jgi:hypothetical protein